MTYVIMLVWATGNAVLLSVGVSYSLELCTHGLERAGCLESMQRLKVYYEILHDFWCDFTCPGEKVWSRETIQRL